jgi:RNA polymerase sigma factor (sigma-70 family)
MAAMEPEFTAPGNPPRALSNDAWAQLYERFARYVLAILRRYVSPVDLEDVAHDFWCQVREKFAESFKDGDVKAWISTTASRKGLDWAKRKRPGCWSEQADFPDKGPASVVEGLIHTEEERRRASALSRCLDLLSAHERSLLADRIAGKKSAQIAAMRGITPAREAKDFFTIKTRLQECVGKEMK